jgi:DNA-binding CsgD family transcriptional regulator
LIDPPIRRDLLLGVARNLVPALSVPAGIPACVWRDQALLAACYALAAFDPRDVSELMLASQLLASAHCLARARAGGETVASHRRHIEAMLRDMARRQARAPVFAPPADGEGPDLDVAAWGYTPWQELISDPILRQRIDPGEPVRKE